MNAQAPTTHVPVLAGETKQPAYQAYQILHFVFVVAPIVVGLDKFFMKLCNWDQYLWPQLDSLFGSAHKFMQVAGGIEIVAGLLVAFCPKVGGYVVMIWLWGIIANLILLQNYYDVALRDFGLSLGALALARLSCQYGHSAVPTRNPEIREP